MKELLDNALDFIDRTGKQNPELKVSVKIEGPENKVRVIVANSDFGLKGFTESSVKNIFNLAGYWSTKRNQHRITRGALGDALKTVLHVPFALADGNGNGWDEPLIIKSGTKIFEVRLIVDKINQDVSSTVAVKERPLDDAHIGFTVVEIILPVFRDLNSPVIMYLWKYMLLNTHVTFHIDIDSRDLNGTFPACQTINLPLPYNPNFTSIWYYSLADFSKFIFGLSNNETFVYTMIKEQFREGTRLKKILETVGELKNDHKKINKLHYDLRGAFESREQIDVPFSINKKQRKEALKQRIEQIGVEIDNDTDVRYQQKVGTYSGGDGVIFPFLFEIMVVETNQISSNLFLTEGINGSPNYYMLQGKYSDTFQWLKNNKRHDASSITQMLGEYGYSMNKQVCKRKAIIVINLISPRIEYDNYGKSIMEFTPFEDAISESVHKVCTNRSSTDVKGNTVRGLLTELLQERLDAVRTDPSLKDTDRWTMSGVFYRLRPKLIDKGMKVNRDSITSDIRMVCEERLLDENGEHKKYTRDELGIIAADRAQLYFDGQWYNVGIDEIEELSKKGADVLIIEKEGVAEVLSNFADELGIALLNTRGFVVEYAEILSNKSAENGANVAILTDFDIDGLKIARTLPNTYRIGIDFNTLEYFGLEKRDVEEAYAVDDKKEKSKKHAESTYLMLKAKGSALGQDAGIFKESIEYARRMRIEIDSVLMQVGNEEFWDFLVDKLDEKFPTRNYNRSVQVPESVTPDVVDEFIQRLQNKIKMLLKPEYENERVKLENFEGMLNDGIEQKKEEIIRRFKDIVSKDENLKVTLEKIQKLNDEIE